MYDMYPWGKHAAADRGQASSAPKAPKAPKAAPVTPATSAVQVALDRRDNGGDAAAEPTATLARQ